MIKNIYENYQNLLTEDKKKIIEEYFKIVDIKTNRFKRIIKLKKSKIDMPLKKQISLLIKG